MGVNTHGEENPVVRYLDSEFGGRTAFDAEAEQPSHMRNAELDEYCCTGISANIPRWTNEKS